MTVRRSTPIALLASAALLSACAAPQTGINDPMEEQNRAAHEANVEVDRAVLKPVSVAYGTTVPDPVRQGLANVADTLSLPGDVVNNVLQLRPGEAVQNTLRFAINATVGVAGIFDVASAMGIEEEDTDFGETLHRWGVGEGSYVVLPLLGPSTSRDTVGIVVDAFLDPVGMIVDSQTSRYIAVLDAAEIVDDRYRYSDLFDSVLYESADSYAAMRMTYLDNRRYSLVDPLFGPKTPEKDTGAYDIYEDFYE